MSKKTLVLGASTSTYRYSNIAVRRLLAKGHEVYLLGKSKGMVAGHKINRQWPSLNDDIHTITVYLAPSNQKEYYEQIEQCTAQRIIFNPGSENKELKEIADKSGKEVLEACTLVMLNSAQY